MFAEGSISQQMVQQCATYEAQVALLTAIRGIGIWTANYALMKTLKQLQAIPYGDVGLLNALLDHQLIKDKKDTAGIDKLFKRFKGWESYLVFYLWRSLSSKSGVER
jgi:DNA-3-methyladenine glycosylase II